MNHQTILTKAIAKATADGFDFVAVCKDIKMEHFLKVVDEHSGYLSSVISIKSYAYAIIFNHEFARALWGDDFPQGVYQTSAPLPYPPAYWQYCLQKMAIAKDPIEYLGRNI